MKYNGQSVENFPLIVGTEAGHSLLGRDWLTRIQLDWKQVFQVHIDSLQTLLDRHAEISKEGLSAMTGFTVKIYVDPNATPSFNPARSVLHALCEKVEQKLGRQIREGV